MATNLPGISTEEKEQSALDSILKNCAEKKGHCRLTVGSDTWWLKVGRYDAEKKIVTGIPLVDILTGKGVVVGYGGVFEHSLLSSQFNPVVAEEVQEDTVKVYISNSPVERFYGKKIKVSKKVIGTCEYANRTTMRLRINGGISEFPYGGRMFTVMDNGEDKQKSGSFKK